jgi:hypothetical protein
MNGTTALLVDRNRSVSELLHQFEYVTAIFALIFVERHGLILFSL